MNTRKKRRSRTRKVKARVLKIRTHWYPETQVAFPNLTVPASASMANCCANLLAFTPTLTREQKLKDTIKALVDLI